MQTFKDYIKEQILKNKELSGPGFIHILINQNAADFDVQYTVGYLKRQYLRKYKTIVS